MAKIIIFTALILIVSIGVKAQQLQVTTIMSETHEIKEPRKYGKIMRVVCQSMEELQTDYAHPDFDLKTNCLTLSFRQSELINTHIGDTVIITRYEIPQTWSIRKKEAYDTCIDCNSPYYQEYMVTVKRIYSPRNK